MFSSILTVVLIACLLCGCGFQEKDYTDIIKKQQTEMMELFYEQKELLTSIKEKIYNDSSIRDIKSNGYIVLNDGSEKWFEDISPKIKKVCQLKGKGYQTMGIHAGTIDNKIYLYIETYYQEAQTMYRIEYSETNLEQKDEWYTKLEDNWFLWEAFMT